MAAKDLHVHVHVTVDSGNTELKELLMTTKDELLAEIASLKELVTETNDDIARVLATLDAALAAGDLTTIATAVAELRALVKSGDDAIEAAVPEPVEPPVEPTP